MSEQINNKNSLEEMKKDLKSLLGIKRNKEPTTDEKNSPIVKSEIIFSEQSKKIEINKPERQLLVNKKIESVIDLTLDDNENPNINNLITNSPLEKVNVPKYENFPLNLSNKFENINNKELIAENLNIDIKKEGLYNLNNNLVDHIPKENTIHKDGNYNINFQNEFQNTHNSEGKNLFGVNNLEKGKQESNIKLNQENFKIENQVLLENKPEIQFINQESNNLNSNINKIIYDTSLNIIDKLKNPLNTDIKQSFQTNSQNISTGFNLSSVKNLSMTKQELLNFFKAQDKNIFANLNVNQVCFFPQIKNINEKENPKKDFDKMLDDNPLNSNNMILNTRNENEFHNEKKNFENQNINVKEKNNDVKPQQSYKQGFSLDMVTGLNAEKDQIIKMFSNPIINPFPLGFQSNSNMFYDMDKVKNQFTTQTRANEDKLNYQPKEKTQSFDISANHEKIKPVSESLSVGNVTNNNSNIEISNKEPEKKIDDINKISINEKIIDSTKETKLPTNLNSENLNCKEIGNNLNQETNKASTAENGNQLQLKNINNEFFKKEENMKIDLGNSVETKSNGLVKNLENLDEKKENKIILESKLNEKNDEKSIQKINQKEEKTILEVISFQTPISIITENQDKNSNIIIFNETIHENQKKDFNLNKDYPTNQEKNIENSFIPSKKQEGTQIQNATKSTNEILEESKIDNLNHQKINLEIINEKNEKNQENVENNLENFIKSKDIQEIKNESNPTYSNINIIEKPLEIKTLNSDKKESSVNIVGTVTKDSKNVDTENLNKIELNSKNEQILNKQVPSAPEPGKKRAITFQEAKEQIDKFSELITNLEIEMKEKYGINIPQFYYEDLLPESVKLKLVEEYFNDKDIIELGKQLQQKDEKK